MELISHKKETRESKCVQIGPYSLGIATWLLQRVPYKASLSTLGPVYAGPSILFLAAAIQQTKLFFAPKNVSRWIYPQPVCNLKNGEEKKVDHLPSIQFL